MYQKTENFLFSPSSLLKRSYVSFTVFAKFALLCREGRFVARLYMCVFLQRNFAKKCLTLQNSTKNKKTRKLCLKTIFNERSGKLVKIGDLSSPFFDDFCDMATESSLFVMVGGGDDSYRQRLASRSFSRILWRSCESFFSWYHY